MESISPTLLVRSLEKWFPGCYSALDSLRQGREWPSVSEATALLIQQYHMDAVAAAYYAPALCACAVWICYKRIYAFNDVLSKTLCGGSEGVPSLSFPVDPLGYLPFPGIYVQAPDGICPGIHGFFAWIRNGADVSVLHLLFLHSDGLGFTPGSILLSPEAVLSASLPEPTDILYPLLKAASWGEEGALRVMLQQFPLNGPYSNVIHNLTVRAAQLLLYLVSANADIDPEPDSEETVCVGRNIGKKLQEPSVRRSHIRQGHWHKYWYGPKNGERRLIPKWIPPVIVGEDRELAVKLSVQNID